jgi:pyruvate/2-oxoglutarate dehydrogenase complex dihydrolipoamide acyltransferase (E2) component
MFSRSRMVLGLVLLAALFALAAPLKDAIAAQQSATPAPAVATTPNPAEVAAASPEAVRLLRLMDTDKNGKISHAEYIAFMEAEFQRLDVNHDGELDLKELEKSQFAVTHHGGTRR